VRLLPLVLIAVSSSSAGVLVVHAPTPTVLVGGRYVDVRGGTLRQNGAMVLENGLITGLYRPGERWTSPPGATIVPVGERTILPGLIDAHVHLTLGGSPAANALATLRAGFTTVLDLGSVARGAVALRDSIRAGTLPGPTIIAAGSWIGARMGVCEFGGATVSTAQEASARARDDVAAGADALKVCVTGWVADAIAAPDSVQFAEDRVTAVAAVATAYRRPWFAHAIGRAGALLAAEHGARALAHTPIVDSAAAARLAKTKVVVISTVATLSQQPGGSEVVRSLRLLKEAGMPIAFGTDAGVLSHGDNARELVALVDAGFTPAEALRAATVTAAGLIDAPGRRGEIVVGGVADLVLVNGDPLRDIAVVQKPAMVFKDGRLVPLGGRAPPSPR